MIMIRKGARGRWVWTWMAIVFSAAAMLSTTCIHAVQRDAIRRADSALSSFRLSRIDLTKGFLLVRTAQTAMDHNEGVALIHQAEERFEEGIRAYAAAFPRTRGQSQEAQDAALGEIRGAFADLRLLLSASGAIAQDEERANLNIAFYELERRMERLDTETQVELRSRLKRLDAQYLAALWLASIVLIGICAAVYFGARAEADAGGRLRAALEDREVLLRELNHRTKNNMQVISAWLSLQSSRSKDPEVQSVLREADARIQAMALVHRKLYQGGDLSRIDLAEYVRDLIELLLSAQDALQRGISTVLELENLQVVIDVAVPCGLILNELVSNSLRYAFPDGKKGTIRISLSRGSEGRIDLQYEDNGVGFSPESAEGLGLKTVMAIGESQLRGLVSLKTEHGFSFHLVFSDAGYRPRV